MQLKMQKQYQKLICIVHFGNEKVHNTHTHTPCPVNMCWSSTLIILAGLPIELDVFPHRAFVHYGW